MNNKTRFQEWAIAFALIIWLGLTVVTCAGLWNAATEVHVADFVIGFSIALALVNAGVIGFIFKKTWDYFGKKSIEESQEK